MAKKPANAKSRNPQRFDGKKGAAQEALLASPNAWAAALGVDRNNLVARLSKADIAPDAQGRYKPRDVFSAIFTPKDVLQTQKAQAELDAQQAKNEEAFGSLVNKAAVEDALWSNGLANVRESWLGYRSDVSPVIRSILQNIDPALVERVIDAAAAGVEKPLAMLQDSLKKK